MPCAKLRFTKSFRFWKSVGVLLQGGPWIKLRFVYVERIVIRKMSWQLYPYSNRFTFAIDSFDFESMTH